MAVGPDGTGEVVAKVPTTIPFSIDWLPNGRLVIVSGQEALLLRQEPDGSLVTHADLTGLGSVFNEIVVDGRGSTYVNGENIVLVTPDGSARQVADGLAFGNGMVVTPDNATLIVAESHGSRLTAFDIAADGSLSGRRCGRAWATGFPTASASMPTAPSGTRTCPTSAAYGSAKAVRCCRRSAWTGAASRACSAVPTGGRCS